MTSPRLLAAEAANGNEAAKTANMDHEHIDEDCKM